MKSLRQSFFPDCLPVFCFINLFLGVCDAIVLYLTRKGNQYIQIRIAFLFNLTFEFLYVTDCMQPGRCNYHSFCFPADLMHGHIAKMLQHNCRFLGNIVRMECLVLLNSAYTCDRVQFRIIRNIFHDLIVHLVSHVVLQDIKNKSLLNRLAHRIDMEGMPGSFRILPAKHIQGFSLGGCSERKERKVFMHSLCSEFVQKTVLIIFAFFFLPTFQFCIFPEDFFCIRQGALELPGSISRLRGVRLIHDHGKTFITGIDFFIDDRELLQCGDYNTCTILDGLL